MTRLHVESQFDPATATFSHILWDDVCRQCALIDSVLDYDPISGRTHTASADRLLARVNKVADSLTLATFLVLTAIYALIAVFTVRIDTQQRRIVQQNMDLSRLSVTDALTGATNRLGLTGRMQELLSISQRFGQPLSFMMLDLDHFKRINDQHGHPAGDAVLKHFVDVVRQIIRASDILGRWGGEEFLLVSPHLDLSGAKVLAEKVRHAVETAHFEKDIHLTVSIGVV
jgi:diguanylate cyclase (GGDEF)-like protein